MNAIAPFHTIRTAERTTIERIAAALRAIEIVQKASGQPAGATPCPCCGKVMRWTRSPIGTYARCLTPLCVWFME